MRNGDYMKYIHVTEGFTFGDIVVTHIGDGVMEVVRTTVDYDELDNGELDYENPHEITETLYWTKSDLLAYMHSYDGLNHTVIIVK